MRLVDFRRLSYALKASRYDAGLVIITAVVGVAVNLDTAVLVGVVLSILLFVPRAAKLKAAELIVTDEGVIRERTPQDNPADAASSVRASSPVIYDLEGELFFGAAPELDRYLEALHARIRDENLKVVILRLKRVRHPDVVCIERLEHFIREQQELGVTVLLAGVRPDSLALLQNVGFTDWLPAEQVFPEEDREFSATLKAVRYAQTRLAETPSDPAAHQEKLYYLV